MMLRAGAGESDDVVRNIFRWGAQPGEVDEW